MRGWKFPLSPPFFFAKKNGERRRKSSLHAFVQTKALHSKPRVFFTSSPNSRSLACEDAPDGRLWRRSAYAPLVKFSPYGSKDGVIFYCASLTRRQAALIFSFSVIYYFTEGDHLMAESKLPSWFRKNLLKNYYFFSSPLEIMKKDGILGKYQTKWGSDETVFQQH